MASSAVIICGRYDLPSAGSGHAHHCRTRPPDYQSLHTICPFRCIGTGQKDGYIGEQSEAKDFIVKEDGIAQTISYFSRDQLPLALVFLFDLTETVQPTLKPLAQGALQVLGHLKPRDTVSIMVFSSHTELLQGFTVDRALATAAIEKASTMKTNEGTFIHEDMYEALEQATNSPTPESRRVLLWLTDGTANFENSLTKKLMGKQAPLHLHSKEQAISKLEESDAVVAALIDRTAKTDVLMAMADVNPLAFIGGGRIGDINRYAKMTGGPILNTSRREVVVRLGELIDQLRGRYTLGYKPSISKTGRLFCAIQLKLSPAAHDDHPEFKRSTVSIRTKRGYFR